MGKIIDVSNVSFWNHENMPEIATLLAKANLTKNVLILKDGQLSVNGMASCDLAEDAGVHLFFHSFCH